MAAVITPRPSRRSLPGPALRPDLRVIPGGRSALRRRQALVYRRRRLAVALGALVVVAILTLALVGAASLLSGRSVAGAAGSAPAPAAAPASNLATGYVVQPGDTLWTIARRLQPTGDVRPLVDELASRNGGSGVQAGQRLDLDGLVE